MRQLQGEGSYCVPLRKARFCRRALRPRSRAVLIRSGHRLARNIVAIASVVESVPEISRSSDMKDGFLPAFIARWKQLRERYRLNPEEHGVKNARLVKLW